MEFGANRTGGSVAKTAREGAAALLALGRATHCDRCRQAKPAEGRGWATQITHASKAQGFRGGMAVLCGSCRAADKPAPRRLSSSMAPRRQRLQTAETAWRWEARAR